MKKTRFTETQIVSILKEVDAGLKVEDICRKHGISNATYYNWKSKYGGMEASDIKKMRELQEENDKLKKLFANISLENAALKNLIEKRAVTDAKRNAAASLVAFGLSIAQACAAVSLGRASFYRTPRNWRIADAAVIDTLNEQLKKSPRAGFWKCYQRLRRAGHAFNHKRVYRVYCQMGLNLRRRTKRVLPKRIAQPLEVSLFPNRQWALDFMHDTLYCGKRFRTLNIIDEGTRECLAIEIDTSLPAGRVIRVLERLQHERGLPQQIRVDNGPELIAAEFYDWCENNAIEVVYIQPGKPQQNGFVERFNGSMRREFLDAYLFETLSQVREMAWFWMLDATVYRAKMENSNLALSH